MGLIILVPRITILFVFFCFLYIEIDYSTPHFFTFTVTCYIAVEPSDQAWKELYSDVMCCDLLVVSYHTWQESSICLTQNTVP